MIYKRKDVERERERQTDRHRQTDRDRNRWGGGGIFLIHIIFLVRHAGYCALALVG